MSQHKRQQRLQYKATRNAFIGPHEAQTSASQPPVKTRFHLPPYHVTLPNGRQTSK